MCDAMGEFWKAEKDAARGIGTWPWYADERPAASGSPLPWILQLSGHSLGGAESGYAKQAEILAGLQVPILQPFILGLSIIPNHPIR